jgi:hypothetical protein
VLVAWRIPENARLADPEFYGYSDLGGYPMLALLVPFLWLLIIVFAIAALVVFILGKLGAPAQFQNITWAIAGVVILIWVLQHVLPLAGVH